MWPIFFGLAAACCFGAATAALAIHPDHAGSRSEYALWLLAAGSGVALIAFAWQWRRSELKETERKQALIQFPTEAWSIDRAGDDGRLRITSIVDVFASCASLQAWFEISISGKQVKMDRLSIQPHLRAPERSICSTSIAASEVGDATEATVRLFITLDDGLHNSSPVRTLAIPHVPKPKSDASNNPVD